MRAALLYLSIVWSILATVPAGAAGGSDPPPAETAWTAAADTASSSPHEPLPYTEEARIARLREVAAQHQLTSVEARHAANTQLLVGALMMVGSMLTPVITELRDESFPAFGSILVGSLGLFLVIEGTVDEQTAQRLQVQESVMESSSPPDSLR